MKQKKPNPKGKVKSEESVKKSATVISNELDGFSLFLEKYAMLIMFVLSALICLVVFNDFIFQRKIYLFKDIGSDSINIFLPVWEHVADLLRTDGVPKWTFNWGMGQNVFPGSLGDPLDLSMSLLGSKNIPSSIIYFEILKILLTSIFFYLYLSTAKLSKYACIVGSLLFAFCGYIILGGSGWYVHSKEVLLTAFFLFALERMLQRNQWYFIPIAFYFIAGGFMYMYLAFMVLYFLVRFYDLNSFNLKLLLKKGSIIFGFALVGVMMASVPALANIMRIVNSPRVTGGASTFNELMSKPIFEFAESLEYVSILMRTFSSDLMGTANSFRGWRNYLEAPIGYIGIISLLLFPMFFQIPDKKRKILYGISLGIVILALIFPYLRYAFWGFAGDYFRTFSFFIAFFLLFLAIQALNYVVNSGKVNLVILGGGFLLCLIILFADYGNKDQLINKTIRSSITIFLVLYSGMLILLNYSFTRLIGKIGILVLISIELIYMSKKTTNDRDVITGKELNARVGFNDYTVDAINYLDSTDKSFFRITKYYGSGLAMHRSSNDAMDQKYKGTMSYSSFNQKYYMEFLKGTDIISPTDVNSAKWAPGVANRTFLQNLVGCKYSITKTDISVLDQNSYELIETFHNIRLFKDKHYLPLGLAYDSVILASNFAKLPAFQKDIALFKGMVINDWDSAKFEGYPRVRVFDTIALGTFNYNLYDSLIQNRRKDTLTITSFSNNLIKGKINSNRKQILFLAIPYDAGWKIKVNNTKRDIEIADFGLMGIKLDEGMNEIELEFEPLYMKESAGFSAFGFLIYGVFLCIALLKKRKSNSNNEINA